MLAVWEGLTRAFAVPVYLLPPPSAVLAAAAHDAGALATGALMTGRAALIGFALSAVLGALAAIALYLLVTALVLWRGGQTRATA